MSCAICEEVFDKTIHAPILGKCGHSVCHYCAVSRKTGKSIRCPHCDMAEAFRKLHPNAQLLELIEKFDKLVEEQVEVKDAKFYEEKLAINWRSNALARAVALRKEAKLSLRVLHKRFPNLQDGIKIVYTLLGKLCFKIENSEGTVKMEELLVGFGKELDNMKTLESFNENAVCDVGLKVAWLVEPYIVNSIIMSCSSCLEVFDKTIHAPILGKCGHSVCHYCAFSRKMEKSIRCPLCSTIEAFRKLHPNAQLLELIDKVDKLVEEQVEVKDAKFYEKKLAAKNFVTCYECKCVVEEKQARFCFDCTDTANAKVYQPSADTVYVTYAVQKDLDEAKSHLYCASCFIVGPHKDHSGAPWQTILLRSKAFMRAVSLRKEAKLTFPAIYKQLPDLVDHIGNVFKILKSLCSDIRRSEGNGELDKKVDVVAKFVNDICAAGRGFIRRKLERQFAYPECFGFPSNGPSSSENAEPNENEPVSAKRMKLTEK